MKKVLQLLLFVSCFVVVAGGCAKKEIIRNDKTGTVTTTSDAAPSNDSPAQVKNQPVQEPATKETGEIQADEHLNPLAGSAGLGTEMPNIHFDFDSALLSTAARDILVKNAPWIKDLEAVTMGIQGHCDERGSDEYNLALGEKRAKAAMQYLTLLGVPAERLKIISYGSEKPVDPAHNETGLRKLYSPLRAKCLACRRVSVR